MGGWDGELSFFGKISEALPLCGLLWGAGVDSAHSWLGDEVDGREFSVTGDANGGGLCGATYLGGWAWNGNLFLGVFEKDWGSCFLRWAAVA
jgi:hypothetical protein